MGSVTKGMPRLERRTIWLGLGLAIVFNSPPLFIHVPILGCFALLPLVFWSLAGIPFALLLPAHFGVTDFGPEPTTPLAFLLIAAFWAAVAFLCAIALRRLARHSPSQ